MESCDELVTLSCRNDVAIDLGEYIDTLAHLGDIGCTNERHRNIANAVKLSMSKETTQLPSVGVAFHLDIHGIEMVVIKQYQSGTSTKSGQTTFDSLLYWFVKSQFFDKFEYCSTLTPRDNQSVLVLLPVGKIAYLKTVHA